MTKQILAISILTALAAAPLALAHEPPAPNPNCEPTQNPHDYSFFHFAAVDFRVAVGPSGVDAAVDVQTYDEREVVDGSLGDCNGDTIAGNDFDGDYEFGRLAGFFPAGEWADDPTCDYGMTPHHGPTFTAVSSIPLGADVHFTLMADPTPPTLVEDPLEPGTYICLTDGSMTPDVDADDWAVSCVNTCTAVGSPGGDGGYWVFIDCPHVSTDGEVSIDPSDPFNPTVVPPTGDIAVLCSLAGHIWSA